MMPTPDYPEGCEQSIREDEVQRAEEDAEMLKQEQEDEAWDRHCDEYNSHYTYDDGTTR